MAEDEKQMAIMEKAFDVLRWHGLWPKRGQHFNWKSAIGFCFILPLMSIMFYSSVSHALNIFLNKKPNRESEFFEDLSVACSAIGVYSIMFYFITNANTLKRIMESLGNLEKYGKPGEIESIDKRLNIMAVLYYLYCVCGVIIYSLQSATLEKWSCQEKNKKFNRDEVCGFFVPIWTPFKADYFPVYHLVFAIQMASSLYCASQPGLMGFCVFFLTYHLVGRIRHLKDKLGEVFETDNIEEQRKRLYHCIDYHQYIITTSEEINGFYSPVLFMYMTLIALMMSLMGYQFLLETSFGALIHIIGWLVSTFTMCLIGQVLADESSDLANFVYGTNWYDVNLTLRKDIHIMIIRTQKPLTLRALSFGAISFATFQAILKTAYSYLALLNQTM